MAIFSSFNNRLPDPTFAVSTAGAQDILGKKGPGFAGVTVRSVRPAQVSRTVSGRGVHRETGAQHWELNITYNPMKRDDFDVVSTFLESRNGRLRPFYVVLPQYSRPKDPTFAFYAASNSITVYQAHSAGDSTVHMKTPTSLLAINAWPKPGDYFNIDDPGNVNHKKAYKVVAVENTNNRHTSTPALGSTDILVHCMPPLRRDVAHLAVVRWINPEFRVIQKSDVMEYALDKDGLFQFSLDLEEIQP